MVQIKASADTLKVLEKQRAILLAASNLFRGKGFHATGMRDIATSAGMTVGNLYYYFRNKEEILAFCQEETLDRLKALVTQIRSAPERACDRLVALIVGHVRCLNEGIPGSLAHLEVPESLSDAMKKKRDDYEDALRQLIRESVAEGTFEACDEKVAALAILGAVNWTVRWFRPEGTRDAEGIGFTFAQQLVGGLMTPEAKKTLKTKNLSTGTSSLLGRANSDGVRHG